MIASLRETQVVCVQCRSPYTFPAGDEGRGCPECGALSWVSARVVPSERPQAQGAQPRA